MGTIEDRLQRAAVEWREYADRSVVTRPRRATRRRVRRSRMWARASVAVVSAAACAGVIWLGRTNPTSGPSGGDCAAPVMRLGKLPGYNFPRQDPNHRPLAVVVRAGESLKVGGILYWNGCADGSSRTDIGPLKSVKITLTPGLTRWMAPGDGLTKSTIVLGTAHPSPAGMFLVTVRIPADARAGLAVLGDGGLTAGIAVRVRSS